MTVEDDANTLQRRASQRLVGSALQAPNDEESRVQGAYSQRRWARLRHTLCGAMPSIMAPAIGILRPSLSLALPSMSGRYTGQKRRSSAADAMMDAPAL